MLRQASKFAPKSASEFQLAYEAGFRNAEFWLSRKLIKRWEDIVALARRFPMRYALHFPNRGKFDTQDLEKSIELYRALNCSAMVIHQPMFERYGQELLGIFPELRLAVENHNLPTDKELQRWAEESPWLTLDVEHLWLFTAGNVNLKTLHAYLDELFANFAHKLAHVHLPGYQPGYEEHRPQYCSREMVLSVFSKLAEIEYEGLIVSETSQQFHNLPELQMDVLLYEYWQAQYKSVTEEKSSPVGIA